MIVTFTKLNQIIKGWINYSRIGSMKMFIDNFGQWLRYKVIVIIIKKWKKLMRIYIQGSKLQARLVQKMWNECRELQINFQSFSTS